MRDKDDTEEEGEEDERVVVVNEGMRIKEGGEKDRERGMGDEIQKVAEYKRKGSSRKIRMREKYS